METMEFIEWLVETDEWWVVKEAFWNFSEPCYISSLLESLQFYLDRFDKNTLEILMKVFTKEK